MNRNPQSLRRLSLPCVLALLTAGPALVANADSTAPGGRPALAVEDTMHTEVPPVLVDAPRVTLDEILDRVARGEARRDSLLRDETYLMSMRVVGRTGEGQQPKLLEERVSQVWKRKPDQSRVVTLREWSSKPPKDGKSKVNVEVDDDDDMSEEIVNFAFKPTARREFKYRIVGRTLLGDHLVYQIVFEPRSPLALGLPGGTVWIDTRDYVVVRQEIEFRESPIPLFLRGIRRMVVERAKVGELWMLSRLIARVETTIPFPRYGRSFDFAVRFDQYALNTGLPDSLFLAKRGAASGRASQSKETK